MKTSTILLSAILALINLSNAVSQDSTQTPTKKKSGLWQSIKAAGAEVGNEYLRRSGISGSSLGTTGQSKAGSSSSINGRIITGEWKGMGAGGTGDIDGHSPRNHIYTFELTQDNVEIQVLEESTNDASVNVYSGSGQLIGRPINNSLNHYVYVEYVKQLRAGTYTIMVSANRGSLGNYRLTLNGPISNIRKKEYNQWFQENNSFGDEGGGGASDNFFSPRNHVYTFEPELDSWFDVQAESNGVPIQIAIVDPTGKIERQRYGSTDGIPFTVMKATQRGKYQIWVATKEPNGRGTYKLDVLGTIKQNPVRLPTTHKTIKTRFANTSKRHEYRIPAHTGNLEIMYRSTSTPASFVVYDAYNQPVDPHFKADYISYSQLLDKSLNVKQDGPLKLIVETKEATVGDYELLFWGNFDAITSPNVPSQPATVPAKSKSPAISETTAGVIETVLLSGRIRLPKTTSSFSGVKVVYEDLVTGQKVGETTPDDKGNYTLTVPTGRKYAIIATTDDGGIASSQRVDLTRKTSPSERISLDEITVISATDVGSAITLNNIFFETGKDRLLPSSYAELNRIVKFQKANPTVRVEISGHTDAQGSPQLNQKLSTDRAISVSYYLQGNGIGANQIVALGRGASKPIAPNATPAGRDKNRRVEFKILSK